MADEGEIFKKARKLPKDWVAEAASALLRARSRGQVHLEQLRRRYDRGANEQHPRVTLRGTDNGPWSLGDVAADLLEVALRASDDLVKVHQRHGDRIADLLMSGGAYASGGEMDAATQPIQLRVTESTGSDEDGTLELTNDSDEELVISFHLTPFEGRRVKKKGEETKLPPRHVFVLREALVLKSEKHEVETVTLEPGDDQTLSVSLRRSKDAEAPWFKRGYRYHAQLHLQIGGTSARSVPLLIRVRPTASAAQSSTGR